MGRPISFGEDFSGLFDWFGESAFRLETLDHYAMAYEEEAVRRFLAGEAQDTTFIAPWLERVAAAVNAGRRMQRVHVVTEPLSDYLRFEITGYRLNVEAGEDVRVLPRRATGALELPDHDFWLVDGQQVASMLYDGDGALPRLAGHCPGCRHPLRPLRRRARGGAGHAPVGVLKGRGCPAIG
jgi:Family of unknown function (DUF6879)